MELTGMEFGLLGPLLVRRGGTEVPVPSERQRVVLAALLLNAGRVTSVDELAEVVWGQAPPRSARVCVQNYVMRLRRSLGGVGQGRIKTRCGGYQLRVESGELDVTRFEEMLAAARAAVQAGSWPAAARQARGALALWRGEPLADAHSDLLATQEVPRLSELRLQAVELRIDADLHQGRHAEVIAETHALTGRHPLRERLHGLLMLALYRDGRQAEALAAYQAARTVLVKELGVEPGPGLAELHHQILNGDPALQCAPVPRPTARVGPPQSRRRRLSATAGTPISAALVGRPARPRRRRRAWW
jgi:DNA-binding SARP family transcriptional activator